MAARGSAARSQRSIGSRGNEQTLVERRGRGARLAGASPRRPPRTAATRSTRYRVKATAKNLEELALAGFDVTEGRRGRRRSRSSARAAQVAQARRRGLSRRRQGPRGRTARARSAPGSAPRGRAGRRPAATPPTTSGPATTASRATARSSTSSSTTGSREHPSIVKKVVARHAPTSGRDIVALKVTKDAKTTHRRHAPGRALQRDAARARVAGRRDLPAHARLLRRQLRQDNDAASEVTALVDTRELWFVCVTNPDGYEYTFTPGNRLWRKNMADNDGNGVRGEPDDGVDPNRNFATNWGRDDEGSSPDPDVGDLPRPGPDSEPETKAMKELCGPRPLRRSARTTTPRPSCCCGRRASSSTRRRRTTRSSRRWPATTPPAIADFTRTTTADHGQPLRPGPVGRALHHQRRRARRRLPQHGILAFTPEGTAAERPERLRLRVRGRRGRRSRPSSCATCSSSLDLARVGRRPGEPDLAPRQHGRRTSTSTRSPSPTATRSPCRSTRQAVARHGQAALPHQRRRAQTGVDDGVHAAASATTRTPASTTTACAAWSTGTKPGDEVEVWFEPAAASRPRTSPTRRVRDRATRC